MIVLDTNVVSELMRPSPVGHVIAWVARQPASALYLTTISEAELRYGVEILPQGQRRERLRAEIEGMLRQDFLGRILPFDRDAARAYAVIAAARRVTRALHQSRRLPDRGHRPFRGSSSRHARRQRL